MSNSHVLFKTFPSLICPPPPPLSSTLTADYFATYFINKIKTISAQFSTTQFVKGILQNCLLFTSFSSISEAVVSKLILYNHPTTCPLDSNFHLVFFKPFLMQVYMHSLTSLTHKTTSWTATSLASEVDIRPRLPCFQLLKP